MILLPLRKLTIAGLLLGVGVAILGVGRSLTQPLTSQSPEVIKGTQSQSKSIVVNLAALQSANLFGAPEPHPKPTKIVQAPPTPQPIRLPVTLLGIVKGENGGSSAAILSERNQQRAYLLGEHLSIDKRAELVEIGNDFIVLDVVGQHQTVKLVANRIAPSAINISQVPSS